MAFFSFTKTAEAGRLIRRRVGWRLLPALLVCALGVIAAGCHNSGGGSGGLSGGSGQDDVVATVNGDNITVGQMYDFMRHLTAQMMASNPTAPVGRFALSQLITTDLGIQMAKKQGVPVTDQQIDDRFKDLSMINSWQYALPYDQIL